MIRSRVFRAVAASLTIAALSLTAACGSAPAEKKAAAAENETVTPGKLTIATGLPAYTPWVMNDKPESGEGFEAELSYKLAAKMGYKKSDVKWVRTTFDSAIA
ncbi:MAG: amino acid ABC transporter substrate-binding protein, partial [Aeriscardovia aeriphila]|nr:amino acid ABC transporter substrate-binding protein [Aeriscardovia aeriphila]